MGPGYVSAACCTHLRSVGPSIIFSSLLYNVLITILTFSIIKKIVEYVRCKSQVWRKTAHGLYAFS